jgi:hypothetical protein
MAIYSAKLLFQWNAFKDGKAYRKRRVCEERIYRLEAQSAKTALAKAKKIGRANNSLMIRKSGMSLFNLSA